MIQFPRSLARSLRSVFRRSVWAPPQRGRPADVGLTNSPGGLVLHSARAGLFAVHSRECPAGPAGPLSLRLPAEALAACEGADASPVTVEPVGPGAPSGAGVRLAWQDGAVPRSAFYPAPDRHQAPLPAVPPLPPAGKLASADRRLLQALDAAAHSTQKWPIRYALDCLRLRGRTGAVLATSGRELFLEDGFGFPWADDVLVPASGVFACPELLAHPEPAVGRTETHVVIRGGPWEIHLPIQKDRTFPDVDPVIAKAEAGGRVWTLDPADAEFLRKTLPRLPGSSDSHSPVTVDLNGHAAVRARALHDDGPATELVLARSPMRDGPKGGAPVRWCVNRELLARAAALGLREFVIGKPGEAVLARSGRRRLVFMPLGEGGVLPPDGGPSVRSDQISPLPVPPAARFLKDAVKPTSSPSAPLPLPSLPPAAPTPGTGVAVAVCSSPSPRRCPMPRSTEPPAPPAPPASPAGGGRDAAPDLLEEAQALQEILRDSLSRAGRLVVALRQQRRQTKMVQSTLATLRQLPEIAG